MSQNPVQTLSQGLPGFRNSAAAPKTGPKTATSTPIPFFWQKIGLFSALTAIAAIFALGIVFSPALAFGLAAAIVLAITAFRKPLWLVTGLLWYMPLEPFLLKFVPSDFYLYIRFGSEAVIYIILVALLWKFISRQMKWQLTAFDIIFAALLATMLVGTLLHWNSLEVTLLGWRGILRFLVLYYVILYLRPTRQQILIAISGLTLLLLGESLLGLTQWLSGGRLDAFLAPSQQQFFGDITITIGTTLDWGEGQRVFGTLGKYEQLGSWLMMGIFFLMATLYEYKGAHKKWLWALFVISMATLALTYSRAGWFGWALGAVIMSFVIKRHKKVFFITLGALAVLILYKEFSGLVVDTLLARPYTNVGILERLFEVFSYERWRGEYFGLGRLYFLIEVPRKVIPLSPIFGFGPGQFGSGAAAALHNTTVYNLANIPFGIWGQFGFIDNNWLSLWAEVGTLGLLLYAALLVWLLRVTVKVYRQTRFLVTKILAFGYIAVIFGVSFIALLATYLEMRTLGLYFWILGGVIVGLALQEGIIKPIKGDKGL